MGILFFGKGSEKLDPGAPYGIFVSAEPRPLNLHRVTSLPLQPCRSE